MPIIIPHPNGDRAFPDDYIPQPVDTGAEYDGSPPRYRPAPSIFGEDAEPCFYELERPTKDSPEIPMCAVNHDPVFLLMHDLHYFFGAVDHTKKDGINKTMELLLLAVFYDTRGLLKQQKTQLGMSLKEMAGHLDWDGFIERLEEVERRQKYHESLIDDDNIRREEARGPNGYVAVALPDAQRALRDL